MIVLGSSSRASLHTFRQAIISLPLVTMVGVLNKLIAYDLQRRACHCPKVWLGE